MKNLIERMQGGERGATEQANKAISDASAVISDLDSAASSFKILGGDKNKAFAKLLEDYAGDLRKARDSFNKKTSAVLKKFER